MSTMRKISRSQLRAFAIGKIKTDQQGLCPLCKKPIDLTRMGTGSGYVVDHDHITGEIRGVLHRGCNGAEGKVFNAIARWTGLGQDYTKTIEWMKNLIQYLEAPGYGVIYPDHKTAAEREEAARLKRNKEAALKRARQRINAEIKASKGA